MFTTFSRQIARCHVQYQHWFRMLLQNQSLIYLFVVLFGMSFYFEHRFASNLCARGLLQAAARINVVGLFITLGRVDPCPRPVCPCRRRLHETGPRKGQFRSSIAGHFAILYLKHAPHGQLFVHINAAPVMAHFAAALQPFCMQNVSPKSKFWCASFYFGLVHEMIHAPFCFDCVMWGLVLAVV